MRAACTHLRAIPSPSAAAALQLSALQRSALQRSALQRRPPTQEASLLPLAPLLVLLMTLLSLLQVRCPRNPFSLSETLLPATFPLKPEAGQWAKSCTPASFNVELRSNDQLESSHNTELPCRRVHVVGYRNLVEHCLGQFTILLTRSSW